MGKSGFRIMLYKLRDFARKSPNNPQPGNNKDIKIERTISLPRRGYYHEFAASSSSSQRGAGQGYDSPGGPNHEKDEKIPKNKGKLLHSKSNSVARRNKPQLCSTLIETRVSAGCSYRVAIAPNAKKSLLGKKKKVFKKNLQVIEMAKPGNPECIRNMENLRERNKGIIQQSKKEYSNCAAKVSFDSAVQEERFGFESLRRPALNCNDNINFNVERCSVGAVKDGGFEPRKIQPGINSNSGRRCSAFCCSCRLSISDSIEGLDESSLLDVDIWSQEEEEEKIEAGHLQTPFVRQSDRVVLDMKIDFSEEDLMETKATLFRPSDVAAHAQVQAKLSQMIEEKGSKKKKKNARLSNLTSNAKDVQLFPEFHANDDSDSSNLLHGAINDQELNEVRGDCYARPKIDRQRASLRPKNGEKWRAAANFASSEGSNKISESVAIAKSSYDPRRDFRESMVEMIMENDIRDAQDLKELLHCYIFLNSEEYHDVILQVFEQVQSDLRIA
ncbi:hypothetical protein SUGI_0203340 [Cryptomeria japonica]|uniref:uncharacterized protein LOC131066005 n=1 Tax=Cryptomeria japonica TaxID=3369 RepID=UPI00240893A1|nr:uncharacterized protein LOC131066005 [Cryptomeria japonica]GLJ13012.1 hypothetical protein SUGI_0203340 [Cryptomeria japonica]